MSRKRRDDSKGRGGNVRREKEGKQERKRRESRKGTRGKIRSEKGGKTKRKEEVK